MAIPQIIHYCWFGRNPLPNTAKKCITSWKKYLPDYEIKEWNEDNFDVNIIPYTEEAYNARKYAFVSDYARFWILYRYGGIYFDTDVEVVQSFDDILQRGNFMGCERSYQTASRKVNNETGVENSSMTAMGLGVAPGLGIGAAPHLAIIKELMNSYNGQHFFTPDAQMDRTTIVERTSSILCNHGLTLTPSIQECAELFIYPSDYFCPKDMDTHKLCITKNTHSIHHYDDSWHTRPERIKKYLITLLGEDLTKHFVRIKSVFHKKD